MGYSSCKIELGIIEDIIEGSEEKPRTFVHSFTSSGSRSIKVKLDLEKFVFITIPYGQTKPKSTMIACGKWRFKIKVNEKFKAIQ